MIKTTVMPGGMIRKGPFIHIFTLSYKHMHVLPFQEIWVFIKKEKRDIYISYE